MPRNKKNFKSLPRKQQIAILLKSKQYNPNTKIRTLKGKEINKDFSKLKLLGGATLATASVLGGLIFGSQLGSTLGTVISKGGRNILKYRTKASIFNKYSKSFYKKAIKNKIKIDKIRDIKIRQKEAIPSRTLTGKVGFRKYSKSKYPDVNISEVKKLFRQGKLAEKKSKIYGKASKKEYFKYANSYNLKTFPKILILSLFGSYIGSYYGLKGGLKVGTKILKKLNPEYYKKQELNQKIINLNNTKNIEKRQKKLKELDKLI